MQRNVKPLHESRCNRTAMLNPRQKDPRDYLEALTRRVTHTQSSSSLGWTVGAFEGHVEFRGNQAEKGSFIACKTGKSRLYSCYKVIFDYSCLQIRCVFDRSERLVAQSFNLVQELKKTFAED